MDSYGSLASSIRQASPDRPDPLSGAYMRLGATASAEIRTLLDIERMVPLGATVLQVNLLLYKAEAWPAGAHTMTIEAIDEAWEPATATWNNQPAVRALSVTPSIAGSGAAGDLITIDVTTLLAAAVAEDDASGARWYGLRLKISTTGEKKLYSPFGPPEYQPKLDIQCSQPPLAPEDLQPSGGRAVSEVKPELVGRFFDPDLGDTMAAIWVQIDADDTFETPTYDSGWIAHTMARFDLAAPPAGSPATPSLSGTNYWHMKVRDNHAVESDWSETVSFAVVAKGTLSLTSPSGATVTSPTPTFTHTFSGTQEQVELEVERKVGGVWTRHYLLPKHVTAATSFTLPDVYRLAEGEDYRVSIRVWDATLREDMPGDRTFVEDSQEFTLVGVSV